jgi:DNA-binding NarL/FixJ family response regulator
MVDRDMDLVARHHEGCAPPAGLEPSPLVAPTPLPEIDARIFASMHARVTTEAPLGAPSARHDEAPPLGAAPDPTAPVSRRGRRADVVLAARLWDALLEGAFDIGASAAAGSRLTTILHVRRTSEQRRATLRERAILGRVITGELQKTIALDLELAPSTVATDFARALAKFGIRRPSPTVPLPIVVLAQKALGVAPSADDLEVEESNDGDGDVAISAARLDYENCPCLTHAERAVARLVAEGFTRKAIAHSRDTSVHTVANQVSAVLTRLRVTGRFALIRVGQK